MRASASSGGGLDLHGDTVEHAYRGSVIDLPARGHDEAQLTEILVWLATVWPPRCVALPSVALCWAPAFDEGGRR